MMFIHKMQSKQQKFLSSKLINPSSYLKPVPSRSEGKISFPGYRIATAHFRRCKGLAAFLHKELWIFMSTISLPGIINP